MPNNDEKKVFQLVRQNPLAIKILKQTINMLTDRKLSSTHVGDCLNMSFALEHVDPHNPIFM